MGHEYKPISEISEEDWNYVLDVNLKGVFNCLHAQLPVIEDNGSIVNVAGIAGQFGFVNMSPYVASNHGIIGLTKCAAKEIAERGVRVNAICPYVPSNAVVVFHSSIANSSLGAILKLRLCTMRIESPMEPSPPSMRPSFLSDTVILKKWPH